ncbi:hypothetical protein [Streptomyces sp. KL116D]|uniref:hypothetical protein n=1 Tax=Streptomyces sp. KL116D TaxID=3045152 RepID=UPI0035579821
MPSVEWFEGAGPGATGLRPAAGRQGPRRRRGRASASPGTRYVGDAGRIVSLEHFGASADANVLFQRVRLHRRERRRQGPGVPWPPPAAIPPQSARVTYDTKEDEDAP